MVKRLFHLCLQNPEADFAWKANKRRDQGGKRIEMSEHQFYDLPPKYYDYYTKDEPPEKQGSGMR